jgi:acyl-CoA thioesterase I
LKQEKQIDILALGDSYTIGESVGENERFPVQLYSSLKEKGYEVGYPEIIAKTGWTTTNLLNALVNNPPVKESYGLVFLLIGVNNQYQNLDIEIYKEEFRMLALKALLLAGNVPSRVVVLSIPDYSYTPFAQSKDIEKISSEIDLYNKINKDISDELRLNYINITDITRRGTDDPLLVADDLLHPSAKCYKLWVDRIYKLVSDGIKK